MYTHQKQIYSVAAAALSSTGVKLTITAGIHALILRNVIAVVTTQPTTTPPVITPKRRPTAGSASGEVALATVTVPLATVAGKGIYKMGYNTRIEAGENLVLDVTTAAAAGAADLIAECDVAPEMPGNNADLTASA
jgi:hypothetical protein